MARSLSVATVSAHASRRLAQRNLTTDDVQYVYAHGRLHHTGKATFVHLGLRDEVGERPGGEREEIVSAAGAPLGVEGLTQFRHHRGEVLAIFRTMYVVVAAQTWIFPVDVDAVDIMPSHERDRAVGEAPSLHCRPNTRRNREQQ